MQERVREVLRHPRLPPILYTEIALLVLLAFAALPGGFDYLGYFHRLAQGCVSCTYNPYFTEWFLRPFGLLDWREGYLIVMAASMAVVYFAARQLGGNPIFALLSPAFLWVMWLGQIDALVALGLGVAWWSLRSKRKVLVGLGLLLLATKPQIGGFAILTLAWWAGPRALIIPAIAAGASFLLYGIDWPQRWLSYSPETVFAGDSWFYVSTPWLLVTLAGVVLVRGQRNQLQYIVAATCIGAPYLGAYSMFVLLLFRLRWWEIVIGYLPFALVVAGMDRWWLGLMLLQPLMIMGRLLITRHSNQPINPLARSLPCTE